MAPSSWVLEAELVSNPEAPILIHAARRSSKALDVNLIATDDERAWRYKLREREVSHLRESSYSGTKEEWLKILTFVFTASHDLDLSQALKDSIQPICEQVGSILRLVIRTKVDDIVQRLGTIDLKETTENDDVDLFSWTKSTLEDRTLITAEANRLRIELEEKEKRIRSLTAQFDDMIAAKKVHEDQLMANFTLLLNEKKARVRVYQKQIVDGTTQSQSNNLRQPTQSEGKSLATKRHVQSNLSSDDDDSDAFESMTRHRETMHDSDASKGSRTADSTASEDTDTDSTVSMARVSAAAAPTSPGLPSSPKPAANTQLSDTTMKDAIVDDDETESEDDEL